MPGRRDFTGVVARSEPAARRDARGLPSSGGPERIRTSDTRFRKPLLYPLSYGAGGGKRTCKRTPVIRWWGRVGGVSGGCSLWQVILSEWFGWVVVVLGAVFGVAGVGWLVDGCAGVFRTVARRVRVIVSCSVGLACSWRRLGRDVFWEWTRMDHWGCWGLDAEPLVVQGAGEPVLVDCDGDLAG